MSKQDNLTAEEQEITTQIYREAQRGKDYLSRMGLTKIIPLCNDFYEGKQWSDKISKDVKHIPRITINVCNKICNSKITNILAKTYKMRFRTDKDDISTEKFNSFLDFNLNNMHQDRIDYEAVKSGVVKGTYVIHYYWDSKAIGQYGGFTGAINGEVIDPLKVYFADPSEKNVQKQEYIIIEHRESVKSVRDACDDKKKRKLITPDTETLNYYGEDSIDGDNDLVTVYTKYFRIDDEVYYQNATKVVVLNDSPKAWNPRITYKKLKENDLAKKESIEFDGKSENEILADGKRISFPNSEKNGNSLKRKCIFYPIVVGSFKEREGSIYGISEIEGIKEVQKAINYLNTYAIMSAQKQGIPKMVVKKDALKGQVPDNSIDQYLVDYTPAGSGDGIKYLQVQPFTEGALQLAPSLMNIIREVTNSNEVLTSDMISKEMSGVAISLLTDNSDRSIDTDRQKYWDNLKNVARIIEQFQKHYYFKKTTYSFEISDKLRDELQRADEEEFNKAVQLGINYTPRKFNNLLTDEFSSEEFKDTDFSLIVEIGQGTRFNEAQTMYMLNNLLTTGLIDQKLYIKLYPATGMPNKGEMLEEIEKREQELVIQLQQENAKLNQELQEVSNYVKQLETTNKQLLGSLNENQSRMKMMQKEYSDKINAVRDYLLNQQNNEKEFAKKQNETK